MSRLPSALIRVLPHLAALAVIVLCARLAAWQFDRAEEKRTLMAAWEAAPAVSLDAAAGQDAARYVQVRSTGRFDRERQILLDNQVRRGQVGVHVFTPFAPRQGDRLWLVNRGWHALPARRDALPRVAVPDGEVMLTGRAVDPPRVGRQLGEARALDSDGWPELVTYVDLGRIESALGRPLAQRVILLDPGHPAHLTGDDWAPVNFGPNRHIAYAWQWITMAVVVFIIWVALTWRSLRRK